MTVTARPNRPIAVARAARIDSPAEVLRPFAWIAAISFTAGFWAYMALSPLLER